MTSVFKVASWALLLETVPATTHFCASIRVECTNLRTVSTTCVVHTQTKGIARALRPGWMSPYVYCRYYMKVLTFCFFFCRLVPSLPPQDIKVQNSSSTSISVHWKPIPKYHVNGILLGLKLFYRSATRDNSIVFSSRTRRSAEEDWSEDTIITLHPGALSYEMTSLKKFTNYSVSILGFTSKGDGNVSQQFVVSTDEDGQYGRVDISKIFVILEDCGREVSFCLFLFRREDANERAEASDDRSIGFPSRLCLFVFFPADFRAK